MSGASELALLVEAEARLDRELADARREAAAIERTARERVEAAAAALAEQLAAERARVSAEVETETATRLAAIHAEASAEIERFEAVRGPRAAAIAAGVVDALVARVHAEAPP